MCWKQEWAMAIHNLALAEIHINHASFGNHIKKHNKCRWRKCGYKFSDWKHDAVWANRERKQEEKRQAQ